MAKLEHQARIVRNEAGTAAVEFAIVLPVLVMLIGGILAFGRGYNAKIELTGAVREGARALALGQTGAAAQTAVIDAAPGLGLTAGDITTATCPASGVGNASVTATYDVDYHIPLVMSGTWTLNVTGVMRCGS